jgi:predicted nucleic acid-binding protein
MRGYLLDTNTVSDWLDSSKPRHTAVSERIRSLADTGAILFTSTVVLGEIAYGIGVMPQDRQESLDALQTQVDIQFVNKRLLLDVTRSTTLIYGDLRARLFEKYAPGAKRKKGMRPEELTDPVTSKKLGIQENDLWIAAQAIERNLVLVSNDAMKRIRSVAPELQVENWAQTEE